MFGPSPAGREFLIELGVAVGIVGYVMLAIQFFTTGRLFWITPYFGVDAEIRFHRETGILALIFVFLHPAILIFADLEYLKYFDPTENLLRAVFLILASVGLILIIVLSIWRVSIGLSYEWWLLTHGIMASGVLVVGLAHSLQVGHYFGELANQLVFIAMLVAALGAYGYIRLLKPFRVRTRPWKVVEVRPDCPEVYRLVLEADGHEGMDFRAGQYAWITIGKTYFVAQQHPFSFMSSDQQNSRVEFGIKQLGDFTGELHSVAPGTPVFLDGPYGSFVSDPKAEAIITIVAGIGLTPIHNIKL
jgi:predicted ferric reductase